jgi:hypothetical protein
MESNPTSTTTEYKQVVVDVPEDRIAEFHAFFARFLAGSSRRARRGRHGRHHRGPHGRHCGHRHGAVEVREGAEQSPETTEV